MTKLYSLPLLILVCTVRQTETKFDPFSSSTVKGTVLVLGSLVPSRLYHTRVTARSVLEMPTQIAILLFPAKLIIANANAVGEAFEIVP